MGTLAPSMNSVQIGQKSYEMPPRDGLTVAYFLTVAGIGRSLRFYETVFGDRILSGGDSKGAPRVHSDRECVAHHRRRGGPAPEKPSVTLDPDGYIIEVGQNKPEFTYG